MRASQLIEQLARGIAREGDREVMIEGEPDVRVSDVDTIYREGKTCFRITGF